MVHLDLFRASDDTCPSGHGRINIREVNGLLEQDGLRLKPAMNACAEREYPGEAELPRSNGHLHACNLAEQESKDSVAVFI